MVVVSGPQLFRPDLDPDEVNDLALDPAHAAPLAACETALREMIDPEQVDRQALACQRQLPIDA